MMKDVVLGIESSCDETSASICLDGKVINNIIATQSIHEQYGGVVPELASRAHQQHIVPVVHKACQDAEIDLSDVTAVQPSDRTLTLWFPILIIGSTVKNIPSINSTPSPGLPK